MDSKIISNTFRALLLDMLVKERIDFDVPNSCWGMCVYQVYDIGTRSNGILPIPRIYFPIHRAILSGWHNDARVVLSFELFDCLALL